MELPRKSLAAFTGISLFQLVFIGLSTPDSSGQEASPCQLAVSICSCGTEVSANVQPVGPPGFIDISIPDHPANTNGCCVNQPQCSTLKKCTYKGKKIDIVFVQGSTTQWYYQDEHGVKHHQQGTGSVTPSYEGTYGADPVVWGLYTGSGEGEGWGRITFGCGQCQSVGG
jgi:hypothetical protein